MSKISNKDLKAKINELNDEPSEEELMEIEEDVLEDEWEDEEEDW